MTTNSKGENRNVSWTLPVWFPSASLTWLCLGWSMLDKVLNLFWITIPYYTRVFGWKEHDLKLKKIHWRLKHIETRLRLEIPAQGQRMLRKLWRPLTTASWMARLSASTSRDSRIAAASMAWRHGGMTHGAWKREIQGHPMGKPTQRVRKMCEKVG